MPVKRRLDWLRREHNDSPEHYSPQPYEQLAAVYRKAGRDEDARKVEIENQLRRRQVLKLPGKIWNTLLSWTVGYGYHLEGRRLAAGPGRTWLVDLRPRPSSLSGCGQTTRPATLVPAGLYTLDLLLPFADLGYQSAWVAGGWGPMVLSGWNLAGWVLITAVVAGLSGLIKRD